MDCSGLACGYVIQQLRPCKQPHLLLRLPCGAVDALQHGALFVTAPVCACNSACQHNSHSAGQFQESASRLATQPSLLEWQACLPLSPNQSRQGKYHRWPPRADQRRGPTSGPRCQGDLGRAKKKVDAIISKKGRIQLSTRQNGRRQIKECCSLVFRHSQVAPMW